jgi:DNA-binding beta-propeller fold protein YncE
MLALLLTLTLARSAQTAPLTAQAPVVIPGGPGHFDFMNVAPKERIAIACHPGKKSFTVISLDSGAVTDVDAGVEVNGVDVDSKGKKLYAAGGGNTLVEFDTTTWTKISSLDLGGPGDDVLFDSKRGVVYVDNDDGTNVWVVDPKSLKVSSAVTIKGAPEVMILDNKRNRLFQNIKPTNTLQVIDPRHGTVIAEYSLGEVQSPHGLAEDASLGRLFSVGRNGKMAILDADSGKLIATVDVAKNSDQIGYDTFLRRLYVPGSGVMQTYAVNGDGVKLLGQAPLPKGCHSVAVDPKSHDVWVVYSDDTNSYAMKYVASK